MRKNCKTFEQWADSQYSEYIGVRDKESSRLRDHLTVSDDKFVEVAIYSTRTKKIGIARCHEDTSQIYIGYAVAWARYKGEAIPEIPNYEAVKNLANGDRFEYLGKMYVADSQCDFNSNLRYCLAVRKSDEKRKITTFDKNLIVVKL
jgi:hypothetical protein